MIDSCENCMYENYMEDELPCSKCKHACLHNSDEYKKRGDQFKPKVEEPVEKQKSIRYQTLEKAAACVCGHRVQDYGTPEDNFHVIADLWTAYIGHEFTSMDVIIMMALMKIGRIATGTATEDSFVDLAGYAACGAEIATKRKDDQE